MGASPSKRVYKITAELGENICFKIELQFPLEQTYVYMFRYTLQTLFSAFTAKDYQYTGAVSEGNIWRYKSSFLYCEH